MRTFPQANSIAKWLVIAVMGGIAALTLLRFLGQRHEVATATGELSPEGSTFGKGETAETNQSSSDAHVTGLPAVLPVPRVGEPSESAEGVPQSAASAVTVTSLSEDEAAAERPVQWCFRAGTGAPWPTTWRTFETKEEQTAEEYFLGSDSSVVWNGSQSVSLRTSAPGQNTAVVWQAVDATPFRGSRVELSAHIRKTPHAGNFFIGVHDAASPFLAAEHDAWLDEQLPVTWMSVTGAVDVPPWAVVLYYGAEIYNGGSLWLDDVRIATVDQPSSSTQPPAVVSRPAGVIGFFLTPPAFLPAPSNLDFEVTTPDSDNGASCGVDPAYQPGAAESQSP